MLASVCGLLFLQWLLGSVESWDPFNPSIGHDGKILPEWGAHGGLWGFETSCVYFIGLIISIAFYIWVCVESSHLVSFVLRNYNGHIAWWRNYVFLLGLAIPLFSTLGIVTKAMILIVRVKSIVNSWIFVPYIF